MSDDCSDIALDRALKITVVGDKHVGKTALIRGYTTSSFIQSYEPTVFDRFDTVISIDGVKFSLSVWDTSGGDGDLAKLRCMAYTKTDCFIVCYLLNDKETYYSVENKWIPELQQHCPDAAVVLAGTKADLVPSKYIPRAERFGDRLKSKVKAFSFIPCSTKLGYNVDSIFKAGILGILNNNSHHVGFCNFL